MKIVVTASDTHLAAPISPIFGRCPTYLFVDTETMAFEAVENPAISAPSGAGIQAVQFVVERGARAVLTGNIGPNAVSALQAANVPVYHLIEGTVQQAVEMFRQGRLNLISAATAPSHAGMRGGRGMGRGRGMSWRGYGQDVPSTPPTAPPLSKTPTSRQEEIEILRRTAEDLHRQLMGVMERLEELEED
jgi:predicted Fe-Mo cluster-binding NifX family protein